MRDRGRGLKASIAALCVWALAAPIAQASNPVPNITAPLVPASVKPGSSSFTLTVNGSGFVKNAIIYWNTTPLKTTFVSDAQVLALVNADQVRVSTTVSVTVVNPAPGGGVSNVAFLQLIEPAAAAALSGSTAAVGGNPLSVNSADFNGDGNQDLAVANYLDNTVSILLGQGHGTFQPQVTYATGVGPENVIAADFNGDGKPDLAVVDSLADTVSILLGNGDGTFQAHVDYATGLEPARVATGDFNGDGAVDLAVSNELAATVSVLLGNGDGTFQDAVDYAVGEQPTGIVACDFSGNDILDLAVANFSLNTISVLAGNGDGTFRPPTNYATAPGPISLVAADFNGDGSPDLVVAELTESQVSFLPGEGNNTFGRRVDYDTGLYPEAVVTGDFNGDGILDLALPTDDTLGSVSVLLGNSTGTFQPSVDFPAGLLPADITTGDFNDDGRLDVATADENSNSISALLETTALLSPSSLAFANQTLGTTSSPQIITLANVGTEALSISSISSTPPFSEGNNCGDSLAASATCNVNVTFTPTQPGTSNGTLSVSDGAVGSPQTAILTGTGTGPAATLSPGTLSFGNVDVGSLSSSQTLTLSNTGNTTLNISSVSASGDFAADNFCQSTLAAGKTCPITVVFKPTTGGPLAGVLSVADDALGSPQTATLTGVGLAPQVSLSPTTLNFATQVVNTVSAPQPVTLVNTGMAPLTISNIITPAKFGQANNCGGMVNPGSDCTIEVTFSPTVQGPQSGTVKVYDNASGSPQSVACTGTGTVVLLVPSSLSFGTVKVGEASQPKAVTLTNVGTKSVNLTSVNITGADSSDFSETSTCSQSVPAGGSCAFTVTFAPLVEGALKAALSISDSGGGSPQMVSLSGAGN
jgi:FG-GAP-like repeat/Abnormal spindle-like microcephaly-assoc'd, ASPM-SPD-2-Hydin